MKSELVIKTKVLKEHGIMAAAVLAVINQSDEPLSTTEMAEMLNVSYPTAQKNLRLLHDAKLIATDGRVYSKI